MSTGHCRSWSCPPCNALQRPVPGCPGWNGEDLVRHTAIVFLQKAETIRTGRRPGHGWTPVSVGSFPPQALLAHCHARLVEQFDAHDPGDPAETWVPEDQTVGFWVRRPTHETAIHRFDLEDALGAGTTPLDPELALDGIDEVLTVMLTRGHPEPAASGAEVRLEAGGQAWDIHLDARRAVVVRDAAASERATLRAAVEPLLLWLWAAHPSRCRHPDRRTS